MAAADIVVVSVPHVTLNTDEIIVDEKEKDAEIVTVDNGKMKRKKTPKRILHFSDGILEEFSSGSDEEGDETDGKATSRVNRNIVSQSLVNPATLTWGPYLWYKMIRAGSKTLAACDYLGEHLANFFGITSPKYQFEVDEYFRQKAQEENERQQQEMEVKHWTCPTAAQETVADQPGDSSTEWKRY